MDSETSKRLAVVSQKVDKLLADTVMKENSALEAMKEIRTDVEKSMEVMKTNLGMLGNEIVEIKETVEGFEQEVLLVKTNMERLKDEIKGIKAEITGLKTDMFGLKTDTIELKNRSLELKNSPLLTETAKAEEGSILEKKLAVLETGMTGLQADSELLKILDKRTAQILEKLSDMELITAKSFYDAVLLKEKKKEQ